MTDLPIESPTADGSAAYLLSAGDAELERLQLQARVWEAAAEALLAELALPRAARALDLGAGAMGIVRPLSRAVGAEGRVVAVDNDPVQLAALRRWVGAEAFANVEVIGADAFASGLPAARFDLVHARFLLAPVGRAEVLLPEMRRLVRPGGVIALQDPDSSCWNCWPESEELVELLDLIRAAFRAASGDFDAGRRLAALLEHAGCTDVETRGHVHVLGPGHPYRRLPAQFAQSLRPRLLASGLVEPARLDHLVSACERVAADPVRRITTFMVVQAWGRAP